jgi:hypothetical protein
VLELRVEKRGREDGWVEKEAKETNAKPTPISNAVATIVTTMMKRSGPVFISEYCGERKRGGRGEG